MHIKLYFLNAAEQLKPDNFLIIDFSTYLLSASPCTAQGTSFSAFIADKRNEVFNIFHLVVNCVPCNQWRSAATCSVPPRISFEKNKMLTNL